MTTDMAAQIAALEDLTKMHAEELHPDLAPYLTENALGMRMIAHPLVHDLLPINGMANRQYAQKQAALVKAEAAQDWHTCVFLHERPYRCDALIDYVLGRGEDDRSLALADFIGNPSYSDIAEVTADVWTDSENIHQHVDDWLAITEGHIPGEPLLMGDQPALDALPDRIEVWRGDVNDGGWSWSTKRSVGEFFTHYLGQDVPLLHGLVDKRYVFGYLTARNEFEVMVRREHVEMAPC